MGNDTLVKTRFTPFVEPPRLRGARGDDQNAKVPAKASRPRGSGLRACPFCREIFTDEETDTCPECGIVARDLTALPPSAEAEAIAAEDGIAPAPIPHAEPLPWKDMSRGRGILMLLAIAGLVAFYSPWMVETSPQTLSFTGAQLAHVKGFVWASFTSWLVLFPGVLSRRTVLKMLGARPIVCVLSAMPAIQCTFLLATQRTSMTVKGVPFELHWGPGVYATIAVSILATLVALRFGGRLEKAEKHAAASVHEGDEPAGKILH